MDESLNKKLKKIDRLKYLINQHISMLRCPICKSEIVGINQNSLVCQKNHCFDLSKKGYVHLLSQPHQTLYNRELFESRSYIYQLGIYEGLTECLAEVVSQYAIFPNNYVLDAGCGEGYFLNKLAKAPLLPKNCQFVGIDIAKEGVAFATREDQSSNPVLWTVGDLANLPFPDKQYQVILNILSPANYQEFQRCLAPEGVLVKVIPGENYLKEIREQLKGILKRETYSNEEVIRVFEEKVNVLQIKRIQYELPLTKEDFAHLVKMTPLTSHLKESERDALRQKQVNEITIDLVVLIGNFYKEI